MTTASSIFTASLFPARPATAAVEESRAARRAKSGDRAADLVAPWAPSIVQLSLRAGFPLCSKIFPLQRRFSDSPCQPGRLSRWAAPARPCAPELSLPDSIPPPPPNFFSQGAHCAVATSRRVLRELQNWCSEKRGRNTEIAKMLGVSRQNRQRLVRGPDGSDAIDRPQDSGISSARATAAQVTLFFFCV
jgi:hypothetical protein